MATPSDMDDWDERKGQDHRPGRALVSQELLPAVAPESRSSGALPHAARPHDRLRGPGGLARRDDDRRQCGARPSARGRRPRCLIGRPFAAGAGRRGRVYSTFCAGKWATAWPVARRRRHSVIVEFSSAQPVRILVARLSTIGLAVLDSRPLRRDGRARYHRAATPCHQDGDGATGGEGSAAR
jgi:hypothetical protein